MHESFRRYGLYDDNLVFLKGWFKDTLHKTPIDNLALLRLDGDLYESTILALDELYDKISPGGHIIIDDYPVIRNCVVEVDEFREKRGIRTPMQVCDPETCGAYWQVE